jgi:hypothetical protein
MTDNAEIGVRGSEMRQKMRKVMDAIRSRRNWINDSPILMRGTASRIRSQWPIPGQARIRRSLPRSCDMTRGALRA